MTTDTREEQFKQAIQARLLRADDSTRTAATAGYGSFLGFLDPNQNLSPLDLFGVQARDLGVLARMRYTSDVIAPIMNKRRNWVSGLIYDMVPRSESPTADQRFAASVIRSMFQSMRGGIPGFLSATYDRIATYGHSLYEITIPDGDGWSLDLSYIPPWQISYFNGTEDRRDIASVDVSSGDRYTVLPAWKTAWIGQAAIPGNFWGMSDLRSLMGIYSTYEQGLSTWLESRRLQTGILYAQETGEGSPSNTQSYENMANFFRAFYSGRSVPTIVNAGMELRHVQATIPGLDTADGIWRYADEKIRSALDAQLDSLGIGSAAGSMALGKEVAISDRSKFMAHVDNFLTLVNDPATDNCDLLRKLTALIGCDPATDTPKFVVVDNSSLTITDAASVASELVKSGVLTQADVSTPEIRKQLLVELGFDTAHIDAEIESQSAPTPTGEAGGAVASELAEEALMLDARANPASKAVRTMISQGLATYHADPSTTIDPSILAAVGRAMTGDIPSDEEVALVSGLYRDGKADKAAPRGSINRLLWTICGGRAGYEYWNRESTRRSS